MKVHFVSYTEGSANRELTWPKFDIINLLVKDFIGSSSTLIINNYKEDFVTVEELIFHYILYTG